jgi:NADH:ubiquinone oxidoreductase subunit 5 (subunit L)/multisubunit Na+/H+ antiporter MnhA subunit
MDLALLVYGINVLGKLGIMFGVVITFGVCIFAVATLVRVFHTKETWDSKHDDEIKQGRRDASVTVMKYTGALVVFSILMNVFLPSEKTAYTMVAAYAAQKVSENDKVQQMSGKVLTIIEQKLDGYIEEGIKEAEKKVKNQEKK